MKKGFITVTPDSGTGNATITVSAEKNTGNARSSSITISGGGITRTITINQAQSAVSFITLGCGFNFQDGTSGSEGYGNVILTTKPASSNSPIISGQPFINLDFPYNCQRVNLQSEYTDNPGSFSFAFLNCKLTNVTNQSLLNATLDMDVGGSDALFDFNVIDSSQNSVCAEAKFEADMMWNGEEVGKNIKFAVRMNRRG